MEDLLIDVSWSPSKLEEEMDRMIITPAKSSTCEYYKKNKDESYPLNLESDMRGRAIVFVMTLRRPGWQHEVWDLYRMFKSLNIEVIFVYDPNVRTLGEKLLEFVTDEANDVIDCCFVTFLGHGSRKEDNNQDVFLVIDDNEVNVWAFCQFIFGKPGSRLTTKPKVFIIPACRQTKLASSVVSGLEENLEDDMICLRREKRFNHYQFLFSCQPGELCDRGLLVKFVAENISQYSCELHMDDILGKKVFRCFTRIQNQMPQLLATMPYYLNIFPGVTMDVLKQSETLTDPVQESMPNKSELLAHCHLGSLHKLENELLEDIESIPVEMDTPTQHNKKTVNLPGAGGNTSNKQQTVKGYDKRKNEEKSKNKNYKLCSDKENVAERDRHEYKLVLIIKETKPNTLENKQDAENKMYQNLQKPEMQEKVAKHLSDDLEAAVNVVGISEGSVVIHITLDDEEALERLVFLSETELLSALLQMHLVTPEFENGCTADQVQIRVTLDITNIEDLPVVFEEIPSKFPSDKIIITCPSPSDNDSAALWSKDGKQLLESNDRRLKLNLAGNRCQLEMLSIAPSDSGRYKCEYKGQDKRQHVTECSVTVLNKLLSPKRDSIHVNSECHSANIHWSETGFRCSYKVTYWLQSNSKETLSKLTKDNNLTICELIPGEIYRLKVRSVPDSEADLSYIESDPVPLDGYAFNSKPNPPIVTSITQISPNQVEFQWEKPQHSMTGNVSVTSKDTSIKHLPKPAVTVSDEYCTALVKNIFPFIAYKFKVWFLFGDIKSESIEIREFCKVPYQIEIEEKTETSLGVVWDWAAAKWTDDMFVTKYSVVCVEPGSDWEQKVTQNFPFHDKHACGGMVKNLKPDTQYEIRFIPLDFTSRPLFEKVTSINVRTENPLFEKPTDINVNQKTSDGVQTVDIIWKPGKGKNTGYLVRYWNLDIDWNYEDVRFFRRKAKYSKNRQNLECIFVQSTSSVTLYHLNPGQIYGLSVATLYGDQESQECYYEKDGNCEAFQIEYDCY